jgi:hypothetical protein
MWIWIRSRLTPALFGLLCAASGLAAFAIAWTPLTVGCTVGYVIVVGSQRPLRPPCISYTDGRLPFVLQSDPPTGMAVVAALLTIAVALGALWFGRRYVTGGRSIVWAATTLLGLALAWPVAFSHLSVLSALFVPSLVSALLAAASTLRPVSA